jgi:uncharacterized membrane protein
MTDPIDGVPKAPTPVPSPTGHPSAVPSNFKTNTSTICSLLYCVSPFVGFTGVIALVLAYLKRDELANTWEASHMTYHIHTFWKALLFCAISTVLMLLLIGFLGFFATGIWALVRSIKALLAAQKEEPMPEPETWLI